MVSEEPILAEQCLKHFSDANLHSWAIVSFSGNVRTDKHVGGKQALFLQAHEPLTSDNIEGKRQESLKRWNLDDAYIQHRIGHILPGETIVFVATAAKHRRDAFLAADFLMDYLKTKAFFWKKEIGETRSRWIEPKASDYHDAKRWQATSSHIKTNKDI